jgi:hypothetical protein
MTGLGQGGKTPYENMFSGLPQTADIGVACRKGNTTRCAGGTALKFQESVQAWTLRSDPPDQLLAPAPRRRRLQPAAAAATKRHLFRPSACHLPDYARRRFR